MAESANTGGTIKFRYEKGYNPRFSEEQKQEIKDAYKAYEERKAREKKNKIIIISIIAIIAIALISYFIFR